MEADLVCHDARTVIEVDGAQHLSEEGYRRDREKDFALQRHGWLVMRFLAADVVRRFGDVLDAVLSVTNETRTGRAPARPIRTNAVVGRNET